MIQILLGLAVFLVGAALLILIFAGIGWISAKRKWDLTDVMIYETFWEYIGEGALIFVLFLGVCGILYLLGVGIYLLGGEIIESICNSPC